MSLDSLRLCRRSFCTSVATRRQSQHPAAVRQSSPRGHPYFAAAKSLVVRIVFWEFACLRTLSWQQIRDFSLRKRLFDKSASVIKELMQRTEFFVIRDAQRTFCNSGDRGHGQHHFQ